MHSKQIDEQEITEIIASLLEKDLLEKIQNEVIIGIEGEKIVNGRDFYSVFKSEENYKGSIAGNTIGELPISPQIEEDENILLAAKKSRSYQQKMENHAYFQKLAMLLIARLEKRCWKYYIEIVIMMS